MASVSFGRSISYLYLGGIAGRLYSFSSYVKNCANYGSVTHSGSSKESLIGGVVGYLDSSSSYKYVFNCLNYGTITHNGTTSSYLRLGGIAGYTYYVYIENCVNAGIIYSPSKSYRIGSLIGSVGSETYINYCYYTDELSGYKMYGSGSPTSESNTLSYNNNTFALNGAISIGNYSGTTLIDALNAVSDYYILRGYSHWLLNKDENNVSFTINNRRNPIKMDYKIIIPPSLASEGNISFDRWYNDGEYGSLTTVPEVTSDTSLYGKFKIITNNYTVTFDPREGSSVAPISAQFGTTVSLPNNSTKDNCSIAFWETMYGDNVGLSLTVPTHNITLYAVWKCTHIKTPDDFIDFSKVVNSGISYLGTTVFLDSDLSLSGYDINPICFRFYCQFHGVFDGQGYVISNLSITKSYQYVGLFGYSRGLTIGNVVLDSSCSIASSNRSEQVYVGGIIGYCYGQCNIKNNVNMASVTFSGPFSGGNPLCLGGIAGRLYSDNYNIYVKNCANYGSVTHSGISYETFIGGVVGELHWGSKYKYIYNCLNYGAITFNGRIASGSLYIGGITGYTKYVYIENCVSAGKINSSKKSNYIGSLVGYIDSNTTINYCHYTDDVGNYTLYGSGTPTNTFNTPNISSYVNSTLITNLNNQATLDNGWNEWLLNLDNETITFKVNNNIGFSLSSQIILLPDLVANNSFVFSGWYTDPYYNTPFQSDEVPESMPLYSLYGVVVNVTFNATGGNVTVTSKNVFMNSLYYELPTPNMTGYTFSGWFAENNERIINETKVPISTNHTLYARWTINNYTVTFNFNNGTDPDVRILDYNSPINYPNIIEREGYTSNGWDNGNINRVPANNLTITALWIINNYTVTFDFSDGTEPELRILEFNSSIIYPNITEREGYTSKWDNGIIKFMPAKNITATAQWIPNNYTVTYIFNNKEGKEEITFYYKEIITYPNGGKKRGHSFAGWSQKFEFMPAYNFTTHGCWIPNNYTVSLGVNGGNELDKEEIIVTFNSKYENLPVPNKNGYTFIGWLVANGTDGENIENEENIIVHKDDIVNIVNDCTFVAQWVVNNYTVTFKYPNGENENYTLSYGIPIEANVSSPSKTFYTFDRWCTEDGKICTPDGKVPAEDIILFPHFTINVAAVSGTSVGIVAFPFLVLLVIILIFIILIVKNGMKIGHEAADVEMTFVNKDIDEDDARRIIEQMEATKISENTEGKLKERIKGVERNKPINEVLDNLGIDPNGNKYGIIESFKIAGVTSAVYNGIFSSTNLSAVSSYLSLLYTNVREQEEFEEFKKLYFGMKEVDSFIDTKDEEEISFGGIVSGFTDKKKVIRLLSENEGNNLPRGVLFKVENGKGYNVGGQDEILFEMNSKFKIIRVEDVIKKRYVVVKLSYASPSSGNEMISF